MAARRKAGKIQVCVLFVFSCLTLKGGDDPGWKRAGMLVENFTNAYERYLSDGIRFLPLKDTLNDTNP